MFQKSWNINEHHKYVFKHMKIKENNVQSSRVICCCHLSNFLRTSQSLVHFIEKFWCSLVQKRFTWILHFIELFCTPDGNQFDLVAAFYREMNEMFLKSFHGPLKRGLLLCMCQALHCVEFGRWTPHSIEHISR